MHTGIERAKSTVQQVQFKEREYKEFLNRDEVILAIFFKNVFWYCPVHISRLFWR